MKFGLVSLDEAEGATLAHSADISGTRLAKGIVLTADNIAAARDAGIAHLVVARLEADDIGEDEAARTLGTAICGSGLVATPPVHGRVNLEARTAGLVRVDSNLVDAINRCDETITLGTLAGFTPVRAGQIVATVKIISFAVGKNALNAACKNGAAINLLPFTRKDILLIQTTLSGTSDKMLQKTAEVTKARVDALGLDQWTERRCAHDAKALAEAITSRKADIILVAGASAISDRRDVIPTAIDMAGGMVERIGMPVDPGNLLCLGWLGETPVIGMPGCARSPKRNGFDWVLERLFADVTIKSADIAKMGVGGLLAEVARPEPRRSPAIAKSRTGIIILAAGRSVRMGANKLLADLNGKPVLLHVVDAAVHAGLGPPIVVTGNAANDIRTLLANHNVHIVHAENYADGLSQSLAAGIRAVPDDWDAALVALGDMPGLQSAHFRKLAAAARRDSVILPTHNGKRGNPVTWGKRFFAELARLEGDVGGKALLAQHADAIVEVEINDPAIITDVDTPEALSALRATYSKSVKSISD